MEEDKLGVLEDIFGNDLTQSTIRNTLTECGDEFDPTVEKLLTLPRNKPEPPPAPVRPALGGANQDIQRLAGMFSDLTQSVIAGVYENNKRDVEGTVDTLLTLASPDVAAPPSTDRRQEVARQEEELRAYEEYKQLQLRLQEQEKHAQQRARDQEERLRRERLRQEEEARIVKQQQDELKRLQAQADAQAIQREQQIALDKLTELKKQREIEARAEVLRRQAEELALAQRQQEKELALRQQLEQNLLAEKAKVEQERQRLAAEQAALAAKKAEEEKKIAEIENEKKKLAALRAEEERLLKQRMEQEKALAKETRARADAERRLQEERLRQERQREEEERRNRLREQARLLEEQEEMKRAYEQKLKQLERERAQEEARQAEKRKMEEEQRKKHEADVRQILELERMKLDEQRRRMEEERRVADERLRSMQQAVKRREEEAERKRQEDARKRAEVEATAAAAVAEKARQEEEERQRQEEARRLQQAEEEERLRLAEEARLAAEAEKKRLEEENLNKSSSSVSSEGEALSVRIDASVNGGDISGTWTLLAGKVGSAAWIGLFPRRSNNSYVAFSYVSGTEGQFQYKNLTPGHYEVRFFSAKGVATRIAESATLVIGPKVLSFSAQQEGETLMFGYVLEPPPVPTTHDWIGIYKQDTRRNKEYLASVYGTVSGLASAAVPRTPGLYQARLFVSGAKYNEQATVDFEVKDNDCVQGPATVSPATPITARWVLRTVEPSSSDWIGLFAVGEANNSKYLSSAYTNGASVGETRLPFPKEENAGPFELRLFASKLGRYTTHKISGPIHLSK